MKFKICEDIDKKYWIVSKESMPYNGKVVESDTLQVRREGINSKYFISKFKPVLSKSNINGDYYAIYFTNRKQAQEALDWLESFFLMEEMENV